VRSDPILDPGIFHARQLSRLAAALSLLAAVPTTPARAELPPLIPREIFFSDAEKDRPLVSPDGTRLAYLGRSAAGVSNIWLRTLGVGDDTMLTAVSERGILSFVWAPDGKSILFQDRGVDGNTHLYSIDPASRKIRDLTPFPSVRAQGLMLDSTHPSEVLIGLNQRDPHVFDVHRVNLTTGAARLDTQNPGDVIAWTADRSLIVRVATASDPKNGDTVIRIRDSARSPWRTLARWPFAEAGNDLYQRIIGFTEGGDSLLIQSPMGHNTTRLTTLDPKTGKEGPTIAEDPRCDIWNYLDEPSSIARAAVLRDLKSGEPQAVAFEYIQPEWTVLDPSLAADFEQLKTVNRGVPFVTNRDDAGVKWVVGYLVDNGPTRYYLYDRWTKESAFLFADRPSLADLALPEIQPLVLRARDGLELISYLTLPSGVESRDLPLVLLVHDGPWWRDSWGFDPVAQWLANRGYAVLQVNYRGSSGFGKIHLDAGNGQMGTGSMQHDLTDAVAWAVSSGPADPDRVAIVGASYGGYAALCGLVFTPEIYKCGIDIAGPSEMKDMVDSFPPHAAPLRERWFLRMGDVLTDSELNRRISPFYHIDGIEVPILIAQGPKIRAPGSIKPT
jgi:dipeptidyl aminopeptidase/acylaminoacyl peptidase